ncbi:heterokaryon incompatibility protein-domain-containing protein [Echria macrotheca]|uniref:Heterokaryon incompatibility protein-domain-containing protein n=1 Tax=Echria macrotheca TaxID=438768 RepID=A0AAJ0B3F1_9PEZI|nr:heterokaryon incompatibility protein-domain-containing protein [Echria macrotheca]
MASESIEDIHQAAEIGVALCNRCSILPKPLTWSTPPSPGCPSCFVILEVFNAFQNHTERPRVSIKIEPVLQGHLFERGARSVDNDYLFPLQMKWISRSLSNELLGFGPRVRVELYTPPDSTSPWGLIGTHLCHTVAPDSSSEACMRLASSWLQDCLASHSRCSRKDQLPPLLPTRVIEVGHKDDDFARLRLTGPDERGEYVALSHAWGDHRPLTTEQHSLGARLDGISLDDFPKTFRDAVMLARFLEIPSVWIDSLCIIQDDTNDWALESSRMAAVYSNAVLTVAADDAKDADVGFLKPRGETAYPSVEIFYPGTARKENDSDQKKRVFARKLATPTTIPQPIRRDFPRVAHSTPGYDADKGTILEDRAWCFQERFLSRRILHYTAAEMAFECRTGVQCECSPVVDREEWERFWARRVWWGWGDDDDDDVDHHDHHHHQQQLATITNSSSNSNSGGGANNKWLSLVEQFTRRKLSREDDTLPALSGIAGAQQQQLGRREDDYACGIWKSQFLRQMLWTTPTPRKDRASHDLVLSRRRRRGYAPSWSWASMKGPILDRSNLLLASFEHDYEWAVVRRFDLVLLTANPYGPATGSVTLRGPVARGLMEYCNHRYLEFVPGGRRAGDMDEEHEHEHGQKALRLRFCRDDESTTYAEVAVGDEIHLFAIAWRVERPQALICLVLRKGFGVTDPTAYTRVGLAWDDSGRTHFPLDIADGMNTYFKEEEIQIE